MDITIIDKNFAKTKITEENIVWKNAIEKPFELRGVFYSSEQGCYRRMLKADSEKISWGIDWMAQATAGGRVRFITDSPYVAIRAVASKFIYTANFSMLGRAGFSVYKNKLFCGYVSPYPKDVAECDGDKMYFDGIVYSQENGKWQAEIYLPLYNDILYEFHIGLKSGCTLECPKSYRFNEKPVVFYGSSITQGGCASRTGNDYVSLVSRWLDTDYVNLGFSGGAKGETAMAEYIASVPASVYVMDYDANAPTAEWLENTHYPMYEIIRKNNPNTPIVFITYPAIRFDYEKRTLTRDVIYQNYLKAKNNGDSHVYFIDGETLFGDEDWDCCSGDCCHPNDLGFYRMAKTVLPVLRECLTQSSITEENRTQK